MCATAKEILLSICIPTFNRCLMLEKCIDSIIVQDAFDERTEIIVVDNNSTDSTKAIMAPLTEKYSNIHYFCNSDNIGLEKNLIKVLTYANGELFKLINDYALLKHGSLNVILESIIANRSQKPILYFSNEVKSKYDTFNDLNSFFQGATYWPTWIGTFSIWKIHFQGFKDYERFEGLLFPHLLMMLGVWEKTRKIVGVNAKIMDTISAKKGGYSIIEVFVGNFIETIIGGLISKKEISRNTQKIIKKAFIKEFLNTWLLILRSDSNHSFQKVDYSLLNKAFYNYPEYYILRVNVFLKPLIFRAKKMIKP